MFGHVTFRPIHRGFEAVGKGVEDVGDGHDGWDPDFAGGDGTVGQGAAAFGDDCGCAEKKRCPGWVGGACDED